MRGLDALRDWWPYGSALVGLIGGAWVTLGFLGASAYSPYLSHHLGEGVAPLSLTARTAIFAAGWLVMSVAMMLPSSLPLVIVFHTMTRQGFLIMLLIAGYLGIWVLFGLVAFLADQGLHTLIDTVPNLAAQAERIPAGLLLVAGLFQFSPLKYACLTQCRSPIGFVIQRWRGGNRALQAFGLGVQHGVFCVGCCWALMLLMLGVGGVHVGWMLVLGAIMFAEKAVRWGRWITRPVGGLLSLWGLLLFLEIPGIPLPF
jgi:predicted metal-binding membrane protein